MTCRAGDRTRMISNNNNMVNNNNSKMYAFDFSRTYTYTYIYDRRRHLCIYYVHTLYIGTGRHYNITC